MSAPRIIASRKGLPANVRYQTYGINKSDALRTKRGEPLKTRSEIALKQASAGVLPRKSRPLGSRRHRPGRDGLVRLALTRHAASGGMPKASALVRTFCSGPPASPHRMMKGAKATGRVCRQLPHTNHH